YALWELEYYGHQDVRLLDGGRARWTDEGLAFLTEVPQPEPTEYRIRGPFESLRAYRHDVDRVVTLGLPLVDVRSPAEFTGEIIAPPGLPETAQRGGHIPGARNIPWSRAVAEDGTFRPAAQLRQLYATEHDVTEDAHVITYCRIGERSAHSWFVLRHLLGYPDVRNYDGSWTEWGNLVGVPIET
ncbi:MAG TPA: rhodanese-like domain-containing protein, partial [Longimicrobiales bacterium]|nr:rhodanese-like domain-containing protein [Longimicrobiales bacterium]